MRHFIILLLLASSSLVAQVPKKVVAEYFTNTLCSICASKNPGFKSNLKQHPEVLHIAYHPSSPYSACKFNQHNKTHNDSRTNYYGVFGSTPRLVIQGKVISPSTDFAAAGLFTPYLQQTSPVAITIKQTIAGQMLKQTVVIKTVSSHTFNFLRLFIAIAEDTITYNAPNGEKTHLNVFRRNLTDSNGIRVVIPEKAGDSLIFNFSTAIHTDWQVSRLSAFALLQDPSTKELVQSEKTLRSQTLSVAQQIVLPFVVYPNPVNRYLFVETGGNNPVVLTIHNALGQVSLQQDYQSGQPIDLGELPNGLYFIEIADGMLRRQEKLVINR